MGYKDPEKQRQYQREWMARRRQKWIDENGPCSKCGSPDDLQVDHLDPSQKINHRVWSWSSERREAELAKCQVLCNDCHVKKTCVENTGLPPYQHGTKSMYEKHGCRCDKCKEWRSSVWKRKRK